jgi:hypothetical protein
METKTSLTSRQTLIGKITPRSLKKENCNLSVSLTSIDGCSRLNSLAKEVDILRDEFCCNFFKISSKNSLSSNYLETNSNYLLDLPN